MLKQLLRLAYERELELEELIDRSISHNKWFFEETKEFNVLIQNACLIKIDRKNKIQEHVDRLH